MHTYMYIGKKMNIMDLFGKIYRSPDNNIMCLTKYDLIDWFLVPLFYGYGKYALVNC